MSVCEFIDTFPAFLTYWAEAQIKSLNDQIEDWAKEYMAQWPDLLAKQVDDYATQKVDWRQIAREKVFPWLAERLAAMQQAHANLLEWCVPIYARAQQTLGLDSNSAEFSRVIFVIYVGIGCGAGWATTFRGSRAILFGLENIAECGWSDRESIKGLVAHEIGHLAHHHWRAQRGKPIGSGPWWQLYEEGFAQRCERLILDSAECGSTYRPHQACNSNTGDWLEWCQSHKGMLAAEFLSAVDTGKPVSAFFGSWYEIHGKSATGYFLGDEAIRELLEHLDLKDIACLENQEARFRPILEEMIKRDD